MSSVTTRLATGEKGAEKCSTLSVDERVTLLDKLATSRTGPTTPSSSKAKPVIEGVVAVTVNVSSASALVVPVLFQNA